MHNSTVYVIQQPRPRATDGWVPNLEPATKYGAIKFIFDAEDKPHLDPTAALRKAMTRLKEFDSEKDFLCWTNFGDPASMWLTIMMLAGTGHNSLTFLYWSRGKGKHGMSNENGFYFPVELSIGPMKGHSH